MRVWKFASRWSDTGTWNSSVLDVFVKNGIAFIYPENHNWRHVEKGDLIAISDGHTIVAVGKATTPAKRINEFEGVHLSEADSRKIGGCDDEIVGVRLSLPTKAILGHGNGISYAHTGRFCEIANKGIVSDVVSLWESVDNEQPESDFNIAARDYTLTSLLNDKDCRLYMIPVFQRPYAWGENELERFLNDLVTSYRESSNGRSGRMFIGTMQLSGRKCLSPRGQYYHEVIDGQQRITTCALVLKVLSLMEPDDPEIQNSCRAFDWIETKVNSGQQQKRLDAALNAKSIEDPKARGVNLYLDNCAYIQNFFKITAGGSDLDQEDGAGRPFSVREFFYHLVNNMIFVVIETEAGLSQIIRIFNVINTTGLDLNGGDLFKVRAFEYLTDRHGESSSCFEQISSLYEGIDRNVQEVGSTYTSIQEILGIYQYILVGRNRMSIAAFRLATETFYERLFDTILGVKDWENFTSLKNRLRADKTSSPIIVLHELDDIIRNRHALELSWKNLDFETYLAFHLIWRSRYGAYWHFFSLVDFCYPEAAQREKCLFIQTLSKLFVVYSVIFAKQVYDVHGFIAQLLQLMLVGNEENKKGPITLAEAITLIREKLDAQRDRFSTAMTGDLAGYTLPKNLICRLLEARNIQNAGISHLNLIFSKDVGFDIEHIQSYNHEDESSRKELWKDWGVLINSTGNLALLESSINRRIKNISLQKKNEHYKDSECTVIKEISARGLGEWTKEEAIKKRDKDIKSLCGFLF